jgi:hypothetical protein
MKKISPSASKLIGIVSSIVGVDILKNTRERRHVTGRAIFYKIYKDLEGWTLSDIGRIFNKNHATVLHNISTIEAYMETEPELASLYNRCLSLYKGEPTIEDSISREELVNKISQLDNKIVDLNAYIADLKSQVRDLKEENETFSSIYEVIRLHTPVKKVEEARKKIRAVLNGL